MNILHRIAHTLLYEGYVLWPYRKTAIKNRQRWTFGGVHPAAYARTSGGADRSTVRAECLLESAAADIGGASVQVSVRFLHIVRRQLFAMSAGVCGQPPSLEPVEELTVGKTRHLSWDEAVERNIEHVVALRHDAPADRPLSIAADELRETLVENGRAVGVMVRSWEAIHATVSIAVDRLDTGLQTGPEPVALFRIGVAVSNDSAWVGAVRDDALRRTLVSTHVAFIANNASFASQFDPPFHVQKDAAENRNEGLWPILVGQYPDRSTMLASPIILYDYPELAPESPGDLFDGGEIDQLLILNILTLTDEEQREMRDSDPRTREILERCQGLSEGELMRLHGTIRDSAGLAPEGARA